MPRRAVPVQRRVVKLTMPENRIGHGIVPVGLRLSALISVV
jgi:hypothetical protein